MQKQNAGLAALFFPLQLILHLTDLLAFFSVFKIWMLTVAH